jgi:hypothetical protein
MIFSVYLLGLICQFCWLFFGLLLAARLQRPALSSCITLNPLICSSFWHMNAAAVIEDDRVGECNITFGL